MSIWALFSVANNYDQPENNLAAYWSKKPDFDTIAKAMGMNGFPAVEDENTLLVVEVWKGTEVKDEDNTRWHMVALAEGVVKR